MRTRNPERVQRQVLILLAAAAFLTLVVRQNILSERTSAGSTSSNRSADHGQAVADNVGTTARLEDAPAITRTISSTTVAVAQPISESNRIIAELVAEGLSPDYASNVVVHINALAVPHRQNRGMWPGSIVLTND